MSTRITLAALSLGLVTIAVLSGCTPGDSATPSPSPTELATQPEPAPSLTPNPPEPDATLFVRVLATAENGAQLSVEGMVHRSLSHEYPGSQTINTNVINDCGASLTNAIFAAEAWSFTRMQVTAIPPADSTVEWPADARVGYRPSADNVYMSARGMIQSDASTGELACVQEKFSIGPGRGAFFAGIPDDTLTLDTFNNRWAQHTWGFTAGAGVTFSECSFERTPLADEFGAASAGWVEVNDASSCYIGPANEPSVF
ncbi:MAG: hypothetical protein C0444_06795 [Microbacterium sp.]|nr:hypothetical protein [Microbacterium sp.]MBA4345311.1 hypothetical protein [Microbacterium sp.]